MKTESPQAAGDDACDLPIYRPHFPVATLKCIGRPLYRSRDARDYASLLDIDTSVISWRCVTHAVTDDIGARKYFVDFAVETEDSHLLVEVCPGTVGDTKWISRVAESFGYDYRAVVMPELRKGARLQNVRDLFRYAGSDVPLGDRIRILAALDEMGSMTLAECLAVVREDRPMRAVASMILCGVLEVDLDSALLGPDTAVRRAVK